MNSLLIRTGAAALALGLALPASAQQPAAPAPSTPPAAPATPQPFFVGNRLGLPINPAADGTFEPMSSQREGLRRHLLRRELLVRRRRAASSSCRTAACRRTCRPTTPGSRSSTMTARCTPRGGSASRTPADRAHADAAAACSTSRYGSDIVNGMLYLADRDGGTTPSEPSVAVIRRFNMKTGAPAGEIARREVDLVQRHRGGRRRHHLRDADRRRRPDSGSDDVAGVEDHAGRHARRSSCRARRSGSRTASPSIAQGNIVVVNIGNDDVLTFSPAGKLLKTEHAAQAGQRRPRDHAATARST